MPKTTRRSTPGIRKSGAIIVPVALGGFFLVLFLVSKVLDTAFFRGTPDQGGKATPIHDERAALAHGFCAQYVARRLNFNQAGTHALPQYTAWDLGFGRYLVRAEIERTDDPTGTRRYLCKIVLQGGDEYDINNWVVQSIDLLP
jgi:hypothetical protein